LGGNSIEFVNQANSNDISWFFTAQQHYPPNSVYFWEGSRDIRNTTQINVGLDCTVTPTGGWNMIVREGGGGAVPAAPVAINIVPGGGCQ
jgi:hypothetical protein